MSCVSKTRVSFWKTLPTARKRSCGAKRDSNVISQSIYQELRPAPPPRGWVLLPEAKIKDEPKRNQEVQAIKALKTGTLFMYSSVIPLPEVGSKKRNEHPTVDYGVKTELPNVCVPQFDFPLVRERNQLEMELASNGTMFCFGYLVLLVSRKQAMDSRCHSD